MTMAEAVARIDAMRTQIRSLTEDLASYSQRIDRATAELVSARRRIAILEAERDTWRAVAGQ